MAKNKGIEVSEKSEPSVFVDIKVKKLPKDVQVRHKSREKKINSLQEKISKLRIADDNDVRKLITK